MSTQVKPEWRASGTAGTEMHGQGAIIDENGRDIAIVYDAKAHGDLLSAAPELYEACKALAAQLAAYQELAEQWFGESSVPEDWRGRCVCANAELDSARAAIAKAGGWV